MAELFQSSLPTQAAVLVMALLLCLAPHLRSNGRSLIAGALLLPALALAVDLLVVDHAFDRTLEVPNVFGRGAGGELYVWITATVTAPAWQWHVVAIAMLGTPALLLWLRRHRPPEAPNPMAIGVMMFWFFLAGRLALEATAADQAIVWGVGGPVVLVVLLPFFGFWCGRRGIGFGKFLGRLALLALLQRIPLIVFAWFATTQHLGTHLDTHVVTEIALQPFGEFTLENDFQRWLWPHLVPHTTLWVLATVIAGAILGAVPRWLGRRGYVPATP